MTFVQEAVIFLDRIGMWDVVLPFIFVFTVSYAVLEKTKVLGKKEDGSPKHRFNALVSFVIGFFALLAADVLNVVNVFSQWMVLLILAAVCLAVIFGFFGFTDVRKTRYGKFFMPVAFLVFGVLVLYVFGWLGFLDLSVLRRYEGVIVGIVIFFVLMWYILRAPKKLTEEEKEKAAEKKRTGEEKKPAPGPGPAEEKWIPLADIQKDFNQLPDGIKEKAFAQAEKAIEDKANVRKTPQGGAVSAAALDNSLSEDVKQELFKIVQRKMMQGQQ